MKNHISMSHLPVFLPALPEQFHWQIYGHSDQKKKCPDPEMCSGHVLTIAEAVRL